MHGSLTSLPVGSFITSSLTGVANTFFGSFNYRGALRSLPEGSFDTSNITSVEGNFFWGFNEGGSLMSLPSGSFDMSSIDLLDGDSFFTHFNYLGKITDLPASFRRPAFSPSLVSQPDNFLNAFNSPSYTLNRNASDIINGAADPYFAINAFSANQPGTCEVHENWRVSSGCSHPLPLMTDMYLKVITTGPNQTVRINKYFANAFMVNRGDGSPSITLTTTGVTKTYTQSGTYTIALTLTGGAERRTFHSNWFHYPLVPKS